jgi:hypothetical protein
VYLPGDASLNKLFADIVCVLYCDVSGCSVTSHQILPHVHIPGTKDSCKHRGVVQSACSTDRVESAR